MNMGKVVLEISMSLDGFVAGPNDSPENPMGDGGMRLFEWYNSGDTTFPLPGTEMVFKISRASAELLGEEWGKAGSPFTFVTDGVESAIRQAKKAAGDKNVAVSSANIAQQCLKAGLLDEIQIDLAPVLLGSGVRLFDHLGTEPIELECTRVVEAPRVTHLRFRILKNGKEK
jgi:dihydrofolate reductase